MNADDLNKCLRGELSAVETYRQALDRARKDPDRAAESQQLVPILEDHQRAAAQLRNLVRQMGATPSEDSGAWGTWSKAVMGTAKLFGDAAALKALKEGEESGLTDYRNAMNEGSSSSHVRTDLNALAARTEQHIRTLDQLIERV